MILVLPMGTYMSEDASGQRVLDAQLFESPLSEQEKALRDLFVNEYLKDFDPFQAALRLGFLHGFALEWGKKLFQESYVQREITRLTRKPVDNASEQELADRALLENTYREAMQKGPFQSRVAAGRAFAAMKGWEKPDAAQDAETALIDVLKDFARSAPV